MLVHVSTSRCQQSLKYQPHFVSLPILLVLHAVVIVKDLGCVYEGSSHERFGQIVNNAYCYQYPIGYTAEMTVHNQAEHCLDWTLEVQLVADTPYFKVGCLSEDPELSALVKSENCLPAVKSVHAVKISSCCNDHNYVQ